MGCASSKEEELNQNLPSPVTQQLLGDVESKQAPRQLPVELKPEMPEANGTHDQLAELRKQQNAQAGGSRATGVRGSRSMVEVKSKYSEAEAKEAARAAIAIVQTQTVRHDQDACWPSWLMAVAGDSVDGWQPRSITSFQKISKIGQGTYSSVYKAVDLQSGQVVAMKKVRFDNMDPESIKFMAREIQILRQLDHPNVVKLLGIATSKDHYNFYLVFEFLEHDLAGLAARPDANFTEAQIKCYMHQILSGLAFCHSKGILHRDIKASNMLLDNNGNLKLADFGLAAQRLEGDNEPLTTRVITLWYRPPELLLGATHYGKAVDLWSVGCILAELLHGRNTLPGRTEVEQLHKIFKLCGSPGPDYQKKARVPHSSLMITPPKPYPRRILEEFAHFPASALALVDKLLNVDPNLRGTAQEALGTDFFTTPPLPLKQVQLPTYPSSHEYFFKKRRERAKRTGQWDEVPEDKPKEEEKKAPVRTGAPVAAAAAPEAPNPEPSDASDVPPQVESKPMRRASFTGPVAAETREMLRRQVMARDQRDSDTGDLSARSRGGAELSSISEAGWSEAGAAQQGGAALVRTGTGKEVAVGGRATK